MRSPPPWRPCLLHFALPLLVLLATLAARAGADLADDARALLAFRDAVGRHLAWNGTDLGGACSWTGVTCEGGRVAVLRLPGAALSGEVPVGTLGNLTALHTLSLRLNALSGALPADLASAAALRNVFLNGNRLSGEFPQAILALPGLVRLALDGNDLSGPIPAALGNLTHLKSLLLENNRFVGEIPEIKLPQLQQFNVSFNQLNGSIPSGLRSMPRSAFLGTGLCGGPLGPCPGEASPSPAPAGQPSSPTPVPSGGGKGGNGGASGNKSKKLSGGAIAGIAIGSALGAALLLFLLVCLCRRSGRTKTRSLEMPPPSPTTAAVAGGRKPPEMISGAAVAPLTTIGHTNAPVGQSTSGKKLIFFGSVAAVAPFDLEDLLRASAEVLGKGAIGTTYKAVLESGATVAVKRLKDVTLSEPEFRERIAEIGELQHEFIVSLRAYYYSKDEKLLVYDFMPTGSLSAVLHGNRGSGRTSLDWVTRSSIALATARGVEYIHSTSSAASHGNIKSSNVLLGKSYQARVSDNGLTTLVGPSSAPSRTTGYRAPEVTDSRRVSQKADVYSFGVLLLELLTGKAPSQAALNDEGVDLPRWVQSVVRSEWTSEVFDMELLRHQNDEEQMVQLLQLAIDCVAQVPEARPSMTHVVTRIEEIKKSSAEAKDLQQMASNIEGGDNLSSKTELIEAPTNPFAP
ncbi:probable inactive receptor kinase RLK902 [Phragmites australis]|uniref:probable inactive receptor kinase RLK902 n=1 Tax=Phragmites australis TaxID=29695 RepID=UPI002D777F99|nr:probable inactive receptor kinase RLK902 [Phragmites australis]